MFNRAIESVMVEHFLSGEKIYDVLGGNIKGAGKAIRAGVAQLDSYSEGEAYCLHVKWLNDNLDYTFKLNAPKELECFSDYEMEKFLLDSINRSIAYDFCDSSIRGLGQLDYSWDNHVDDLCSSVNNENKAYYQGLIKLLDGSHDGIRLPSMHPKMARALVHNGILKLNAENFMKLMPREEITECFKAFNDFISSSFQNRFFDSSIIRKGFNHFFQNDYLPKFMTEPERQAKLDASFART